MTGSRIPGLEPNEAAQTPGCVTWEEKSWGLHPARVVLCPSPQALGTPVLSESCWDAGGNDALQKGRPPTNPPPPSPPWSIRLRGTAAGKIRFQDKQACFLLPGNRGCQDTCPGPTPSQPFWPCCGSVPLLPPRPPAPNAIPLPLPVTSNSTIPVHALQNWVFPPA